MDDDAQICTQTTNSRLLTIRDVAELAGVSIMTVRRWIDHGGLHVHRLGKLVRISHADLAAFLSSRRAPSKIS
jgi:excisionase family DNA binding protein